MMTRYDDTCKALIFYYISINNRKMFIHGIQKTHFMDHKIYFQKYRNIIDIFLEIYIDNMHSKPLKMFCLAIEM